MDQISLIKDLNFLDLPENSKVVERPTSIFPRIKAKEEVEFVSKLVSKSTKGKGRAHMEELKKEEQKSIQYDDFSKVKMVVAEIKEAEFLPNSEKLIKFILDDGHNHHRQILSGIRKWYPEPEKLIGKKVIIVANLAARKMAGSQSEGMILAGENGDGNVVLTLMPDVLEPGAEIS